jgi:hypothetical protein
VSLRYASDCTGGDAPFYSHRLVANYLFRYYGVTWRKRFLFGSEAPGAKGFPALKFIDLNFKPDGPDVMFIGMLKRNDRYHTANTAATLTHHEKGKINVQRLRSYQL